MAGTRTYYRDDRGRFHGSSGGRATTGRAGGFANASFRARVLASRGNARPSSGGGQKASRGKHFRIGSPSHATRRKIASVGLIAATGATTAGAFGVTRMVGGSRLTASLVAANAGLAGGATVARAARVVVGKPAGRSAARPRTQAGKKLKR